MVVYIFVFRFFNKSTNVLNLDSRFFIYSMKGSQKVDFFKL